MKKIPAPSGIELGSPGYNVTSLPLAPPPLPEVKADRKRSLLKIKKMAAIEIFLKELPLFFQGSKFLKNRIISLLLILLSLIPALSFFSLSLILKKF